MLNTNTKYLAALLLSLMLLPVCTVVAQEINIVPYLKQIEDGKKDSVKQILTGLKKNYPDDPSVMFLDGVLMENGQQSVAVYNKILQKYPHSKYADASLYRIYSYYFAIGLYNEAKNYLDKLTKEYPGSPYLKIARKEIPAGTNTTLDSNKIDNSPQPVKAIDTSGESGKEYKFTIQAGAFSLLQNAEALRKSFDASGYYSKIEDKLVAGTTFHVVYVGRYSSEDDAKKSLQKINSKFNLDGRVIPITEK